MTPDEIVSAHPTVFPDGRPTLGISVGDGWLPIVNGLCDLLERHLKNLPVITGFRVLQVKEKLGRLRFHVTGDDDLIRGAIWMAKTMASITCEECGAPGTERDGRWILTLCDRCHHDILERHGERTGMDMPGAEPS